MEPRYPIKTVNSQTGEELPILMNLKTGFPEVEANVFVLTHHRQRSLASSTMVGALRDIGYLHIYFDCRNIDLDARFAQGLGLTLQEIDGLANHCATHAKDFYLSSTSNNSISLARVPVSGKSLEKVRMRSGKRGRSVCKRVYFSRLATARDYIKWRVDQFISRHPTMTKDDKKALRLVKNEMTTWMTARIPVDKDRNQVGQREGLNPQVVDRLLSITACDSPDNPWRSRHCQIRNALMISWFRTQGVRRGELLGIKIPDLDFQQETVLIARRPDDP